MPGTPARHITLLIIFTLLRVAAPSVMLGALAGSPGVMTDRVSAHHHFSLFRFRVRGRIASPICSEGPILASPIIEERASDQDDDERVLFVRLAPIRVAWLGLCETGRVASRPDHWHLLITRTSNARPKLRC